MVVVPGVIPETSPVDTSIVATEVLLLLHVPLAGVQLIVVLLPKQTEAGPVITAGAEFTVTSAVV